MRKSAEPDDMLIIAGIIDGAIVNCEGTRPAESFVCSYDRPTVLSDTTEYLMHWAVDRRSVTLADAPKLSNVESDQLFAAAAHLGMLEAGATHEELFSVADEGEFELIELYIFTREWSLSADWVKFYAGDNEVGVVFEKDTSNIIGEVSDGDVMGCVPEV